MKPFLNEDFCLSGETAPILYHRFAEKAPIIDFHCHLSPEEIATDKRFSTITEVWLGGDHYKWRLMRADGVPEKLITGDGDDREKFRAWAGVMPRLIGSPLYHWSHMELKKYFGIDFPLTPENADYVFDKTAAMLATGDFSAKKLIERSNVKALCTTDDPVDDLHWHQQIRSDGFPVKVLPAFRPDRVLSPEKPDYPDYVETLENAAEIKIDSLESLFAAIRARMEHFSCEGCVLSDHGMADIPFRPVCDEEADRILKKRLGGQMLTADEEESLKTTLLLFLGKEYARLGWAMQLHLGVTRSRNTAAAKALGPDTGFDGIGSPITPDKLYRFLDALESEGALPRTVLYSLNPNDNALLDVIAGCFQSDCGIAHMSKIQHGAAWWFNDHKDGMTDQLRSFAAEGVLGNFIGMLTDSRSFLSYARHDYFRRILCNYLGNLVDAGEYPADPAALQTIVEDICWKNAERYFEI